MQTIDINNLAVIYMTTEVDRDRINQDPPQLPYEPENALAEQDLVDSMKSGASNYDYYKNIVQCSIFWQSTYYHFMYCDDPKIPNRKLDGDWRRITVVDYERDLICGVSSLINTIVPTTVQGFPLGGGTIAGWRLMNEIWPIIANKSFAAGCILPRCLMADPLKRYTTASNMLDISMIYTQGAAPNIRRLPFLADVLRYWGFTDKLPSPSEIRADICRDPLMAAHKVELYLLCLEAVIRQYCGYEMRNPLNEGTTCLQKPAQNQI